MSTKCWTPMCHRAHVPAASCPAQRCVTRGMAQARGVSCPDAFFWGGVLLGTARPCDQHRQVETLNRDGYGNRTCRWGPPPNRPPTSLAHPGPPPPPAPRAPEIQIHQQCRSRACAGIRYKSWHGVWTAGCLTHVTDRKRRPGSAQQSWAVVNSVGSASARNFVASGESAGAPT